MSRKPSTPQATISFRGLFFDDLPFNPTDVGLLASAYTARAKALRGRYTGQPVPRFSQTQIATTNWSGAAGDAYRRMHGRLETATETLIAQYEAAARILTTLQNALAADLAAYQEAAVQMAALKTDPQGATPAQSAALERITARADQIRRQAIAVTEEATTRLAKVKSTIIATMNTMSKVHSNAMPLVEPEVRTKRKITIVKPGGAAPAAPTRPSGVAPSWPLAPGVMGPVLIPKAPGATPAAPAAPTRPSGVAPSWPLAPGVTGPVVVPKDPKARPTSYTVKAGNSWWQIADWTLREVGLTPTGSQVKKYMTSLQEANPPGAKSFLPVGKVLVLPSPSEVLDVVVTDTP
jgi:hypothetical protein